MKSSDTKKSSRVSGWLDRLWQADPADYRGIKRHLLKHAQVAALVVRDFIDDQCFIQASALSFTTILSLVPFFALMFAVLKGLGVQNQLEPYILQQVAAGQEELVERIITYINNTKMTSVGAIGLITLFLTAIALLGNIENTFNSIWGVKETRSLYRKFSDYVSVIVSAPILLLAATSVTTSLQSQDLVQWLMKSTYLGDLLMYGVYLVPYISIWVALIFLYVFIPNTAIHFKSAVIGGLIAGTLWQAAQWGYVNFQVGVARYNAVYGTLALLPIFMVWIYTSWLIVLFGVEVVYAHQNIRTFRREVRHRCINYATREMLTLSVLFNIGEAFYYGKTPWTAERLAEELDMPVRIVREVLAELAGAGYVSEAAGDEGAFLPARELEHMEVNKILAVARTYGDAWVSKKLLAGRDVLADVIAKAEASSSAAVKGVTIRDLVLQQGGRQQAV